METHDIGIWFLLISLFVPRFTLFFWWITENLPYNTTPLWTDVVCSILIPRVLILVYIYGCQGLSPWFWIHLAVMFVIWAYQSITFSKNLDKFIKMFEKS